MRKQICNLTYRDSFAMEALPATRQAIVGAGELNTITRQLLIGWKTYRKLKGLRPLSCLEQREVQPQ